MELSFAEANEAALFEKRMAYPSPKALAESLRSGTFLNNPVTTAALSRVQDIYGPSTASLKGKTTFRTTPSQHVVHLPRDLSQLITLFMDIMIVAGQLFLVSYSEPLHLLARIQSDSCPPACSEQTPWLPMEAPLYRWMHLVRQ